jgi:hypothetical protein
MPVPTVITDLSTTAASNFPAGSDAPSTIDDTLRAHGAFIAQLRDGPHVPSLGSAGAPAYAFVADTNTGVFSPGANIWGVATNGVERLRITAAGVIQDPAGDELGYKGLPLVQKAADYSIAQTDNGKKLQMTTNNNFTTALSLSDDYTVTLINTSGFSITINQVATSTLRLSSTGASGNITLPDWGVAVLTHVGGNIHLVAVL